MIVSTRAVLLSVVMSVTAGPAAAATVYQLSQSEIDAVAPLNATAEGIPLADAPLKRDDRAHGEIGTVFGTGGTRAIYGSTVVPLGSGGYAAFSFEDGRYPGYRVRR